MRVIQLAGRMSGGSAEVAPRCDKCFVALLSVPQNQNGFIRRLRGKPVIWHSGLDANTNKIADRTILKALGFCFVLSNDQKVPFEKKN